MSSSVQVIPGQVTLKTGFLGMNFPSLKKVFNKHMSLIKNFRSFVCL